MGRASHGTPPEQRQGDIWSGTEESWSFSWSPIGPPEFATYRDSLVDESVLRTGLSNFGSVIHDLLRPAAEKLRAARRHQEAGALNRVFQAEGEGLSNAAPEASKLWQEIYQATGETLGGWIGSKPDSAAREQAGAERLKAAGERLKGLKRQWEGKYADAAERAAGRIESVAAEDAKRIRERAAELRSKGVEAFANLEK